MYRLLLFITLLSSFCSYSQSFGIDLDAQKQKANFISSPYKSFLVGKDQSKNIKGVDFSLVSNSEIKVRERDLKIVPGSKNKKSLLKDFIFAFPEEKKSFVGIKIKNLLSGNYEIKSYHYEPNSKYAVNVKVVLREVGSKKYLQQKMVSGNSPNPVVFNFNAKQGKNYEVIALAQKTENKAYRTRFNSLLITPQ